ncbi:MAG: chemotaxis protein CheA [Rhodospirillaceae bacterium]|nr:MAG: chemotaxis protein CheA [Rhodospirillaceae bacterium]
MDELITDFVAETTESLSVLDQELVRFEQSPNDSEILGNIFRMMHTIKGTCGFLGLPRLEKVAHAGEDVLGKFRDGTLQPAPESVTLILRCIDQIRSIVDNLASAGTEGDGDDSAIIGELRTLADGPAEPSEEPAAPSVDGGPVLSDEGFPVAADLLAEVALAVAPVQAPKPKQQQQLRAVQTSAADAPIVVRNEPEKSEAKPDSKVDAPKDRAGSQTIRVNVEVLENLMTLVSEMVLTRNQLLQLTRLSEDSVFKEPIQRLSRTTTELQEGVMKTRMQPIGNAWSKLPRIVRDLANELGKKINIDMHGEDTELDRQVLELIQDPLTHMVRNSADHGLETPDERLAGGKHETGTIRLSAFHEGGHIIIEIADDGRGLNTERIRAKIVERGMATSEEAAAMDESQVNQFIMKPGFSTAEKVTKVSGRGVGMDVVRSNIEKIGGTIEFRSAFGLGSTFTIKIPLTLAIISSLVVQCGGERFALPQIAVNEVVRISERSEHRIESLKGLPVLRLRDSLLPLINLRQILKLDGESTGWSPGCNTFEGYVVICRNGSQVLGIIVDSIADAEEIVVKPLSAILGTMRYFSGNTILGDGRVILILDLNDLASDIAQEPVQPSAAREPAEDIRKSGESALLFHTQAEGMKAVPLSRVHRIESFDMATVEVVQGNRVVQYRDQLLPLMSLDGEEGIRREGRQTVLVFGSDGAAVGLAIETIVDIVYDELAIRKPSRSAGVRGSGIVAGRAVDIIEPEYFLAQIAEDVCTAELEVAA